MSLVVCANRDSDRPDDASGSIFEPWSFKNGLSSTYEIPANAQVGLHSCKINLNGTMTLSSMDVLYQYFGETLDNDVATKDNINLSTALPIMCPLSKFEHNWPPSRTRQEDYDAEGVAKLLTERMNNYIFHPNLRDLVDVDIVVDPATTHFDGYEITYDQYKDETTSTIPTASEVWTNIPTTTGRGQGWDTRYATERYDYPGGVLRPEYPHGDNPPANLTWNYSIVGASGVFKTVTHDPENPQPSMISTDLPLSQYGGKFEVDIAHVNASGLNWTVGLSRYCNEVNYLSGYPTFAPPYFQADRGPDSLDFNFFDYAVVRDGDLLYVQHTVTNQDPTFEASTPRDTLFPKSLDYWTAGGSTFASQYDIGTNASLISKVRFKLRGQQIQIDLIDSSSVAHNLYTYDATRTKDLQLKPISQTNWCLHPCLRMETTPLIHANFMYIEKFNGCTNILDYGVGMPDDYAQAGRDSFAQVGWYEFDEEFGGAENSYQIDMRYWNDMNDTATGPNANGQLTYAGLPTAGNNRRIGYKAVGGEWTAGFQNVLITAPSSLYAPSGQANMRLRLGFTTSVVTTFTDVGAGALDLGLKFTSDGIARLTSNNSIFVRLDNFTQLTKNAFKGNHSGIIAHLPRFDGQTETGRLYYQPSEIAWVSLNNPHSLRVSSFDLSFCYVNEQYVTALTGQSIVVLMFRQDPSMK